MLGPPIGLLGVGVLQAIKMNASAAVPAGQKARIEHPSKRFNHGAVPAPDHTSSSCTFDAFS